MTKHGSFLSVAITTTLLAFGCDQPAPPRATATTATPPSPAPPPPPPAPTRPRSTRLDPVRVTAQAANRRALDSMARSVGCPHKLPSAYVKYCEVAASFASGTAAEIPDGKTLLLAGEVAIIETGPPRLGTLGTSMPVVWALRRQGAQVWAKQAVLVDPDHSDETGTALARIAGALDGKWDHADIPASFAAKIEALENEPMDPLEPSGDSYWPHDLDGVELRRAGSHWMFVGAPSGPDGRHIVGILHDAMKVLGPKEKSPQKVTVLHWK